MQYKQMMNYFKTYVERFSESLRIIKVLIMEYNHGI